MTRLCPMGKVKVRWRDGGGGVLYTTCNRLDAERARFFSVCFGRRRRHPRAHARPRALSAEKSTTPALSHFYANLRSSALNARHLTHLPRLPLLLCVFFSGVWRVMASLPDLREALSLGGFNFDNARRCEHCAARQNSIRILCSCTHTLSLGRSHSPPPLKPLQECGPLKPRRQDTARQEDRHHHCGCHL